MKKAKKDDMRSEYRRGDLGKGMRGKYFKAYREGTNLVLLKPEVAAAFPTEQAVNSALTALIRAGRQNTGFIRRQSRLSKRTRPTRHSTMQSKKRLRKRSVA